MSAVGTKEYHEWTSNISDEFKKIIDDTSKAMQNEVINNTLWTTDIKEVHSENDNDNECEIKQLSKQIKNLQKQIKYNKYPQERNKLGQELDALCRQRAKLKKVKNK